jgi:hypothetical protein
MAATAIAAPRDPQMPVAVGALIAVAYRARDLCSSIRWQSLMLARIAHLYRLSVIAIAQSTTKKLRVGQVCGARGAQWTNRKTWSYNNNRLGATSAADGGKFFSELACEFSLQLGLFP